MLSIFLFVGVCLANPKVLYLNELISGNVKYLEIENLSNLYLASNDNVDLLKNITVYAGQQTTLDTLLNMKNDDGSQKPFNIDNNNTIGFQTTNNQSAQNQLTGFVYISTLQQAQDPNFSVYVINDQINITKSSNLSTTVILNTFYGFTDYWYSPLKTSYVNNIVQDRSSKLWLHSDIPYDNYTSHFGWQSIFYNPLIFYNFDGNTTTQEEVFFEHIEPLQLSYDYWYILSIGEISMTVDKKWVNFVDSKTTSKTTTGLIANAEDGLFNYTQINFSYEPTNNRTTGFYAVASNPEATIDIVVSSDHPVLVSTYNETETTMGTLEYSDNDATQIHVKTSKILPGKFSIQYFVIDGISVYPQNETSQSPTTTTTIATITTTVQTTTSSTFRSSLLMSFLFLLIKNLSFL